MDQFSNPTFDFLTDTNVLVGDEKVVITCGLAFHVYHIYIGLWESSGWITQAPLLPITYDMFFSVSRINLQIECSFNKLQALSFLQT